MSLNLPKTMIDALSGVVELDSQLQNGDPLSPSPIFASTYALSGDPANIVDVYGRDTNPMWRAVEAVLGRLEDGEAVLFPSGMAAASACLFPFLSAGDILLIPSDGYYTVRNLATHFLAPFGIEVRTYDTATALDQDLEDVRLMWVETPNNPGLDVCDLAALSSLARESDTLLVADNTTMTPLGQSCLALGVDLVMSSDTKAMNGHCDVLVGHVASQSTDLMDKVRYWRKTSGSIPSSMDAWLLYRGMQTLELRFSRACDNALAVAKAAQDHAAVGMVRQPLLEGDASFDLAQKQMRTGGPLAALYFAGEAEAERFLDALRLTTVATSFGGVHSLAERRARWDATNPPGLVRFAAGCEPTKALVDDVVQALNAV